MKMTLTAVVASLVVVLAWGSQPAAAAEVAKQAPTQLKNEVKPPKDKDKDKRSKENPNDPKDTAPTDGNAGSGNDTKPKPKDK